MGRCSNPQAREGFVAAGSTGRGARVRGAKFILAGGNNRIDCRDPACTYPSWTSPSPKQAGRMKEPHRGSFRKENPLRCGSASNASGSARVVLCRSMSLYARPIDAPPPPAADPPPFSRWHSAGSTGEPDKRCVSAHTFVSSGAAPGSRPAFGVDGAPRYPHTARFDGRAASCTGASGHLRGQVDNAANCGSKMAPPAARKNRHRRST